MYTNHVIVPNIVSLTPTLFLTSMETELAMIPSTSTDPQIPCFVPKEEPILDSQPNTPSQLLRKVPACSICGADSTGIHFGVDACAACSAFFRRTVVLNKVYICSRGGACPISKDANGQKCRACRFKQCETSGMDKTAVQHRRDAIGKYSAGVKRECSPIDMKTSASPASPSPVQSQSEGSVLEDLLEKHNCLMKKRKIFYSNKGCEELFHEGDLDIVELTNYEECMYQLWRIEPRLAAEFVAENKHLLKIDPKEKAKLFRNFVILRQAVEEPYLTWKFGGLDKGWWIMPNRIYFDINQGEKYWKTGIMNQLKLTHEQAKGLFVSSFMSAMKTISTQMKNLNLHEKEMIALCGLTLLDPTVATLNPKCKEEIWRIRDILIKDIFNLYEGHEDPELRMAELLMILGSVKTHALKTLENMHLINTFQLIAQDQMFEDICRGNKYNDTDQIP
ncbi:unnamed protein product [Auanema sp. JU1783]|nr:unnamed protein product [Auanema sp. JU1783]